MSVDVEVGAGGGRDVLVGVGVLVGEGDDVGDGGNDVGVAVGRGVLVGAEALGGVGEACPVLVDTAEGCGVGAEVEVGASGGGVPMF